jgi:F-box and WD-40 domain protein CDC4
VFPGGARASFRDGEDGEEDMQEEEQLAGGVGWSMLRRNEESSNGKVVGLVDAVERFGKKRSNGVDGHMHDGRRRNHHKL